MKRSCKYDWSISPSRGLSLSLPSLQFLLSHFPPLPDFRPAAYLYTHLPHSLSIRSLRTVVILRSAIFNKRHVSWCTAAAASERKRAVERVREKNGEAMKAEMPPSEGDPWLELRRARSSMNFSPFRKNKPTDQPAVCAH